MPDAIIAELWRIKDAMAREHGYDVRVMAAYLRDKEQSLHAQPSKSIAAPATASGVGGPK